ncbi:MAG: UDP-N-acetylmuramate--L-alanine ligase [Acidimicrobiales bacterium]|nr:UDP-N-acetylmuramate--L-alanine ligase [Acidimicrobiales bacterium]
MSARPDRDAFDPAPAEREQAVRDRADPRRVPDLASPRRIHVVNVGGAGMSAVATVLAQMGHAVSGTDHNETPFLGPLRALGVDVAVGPASPAAPASAVVVTSTATPTDHPDVVSATRAGVPVVHRRDVLAAICTQRQVTAVAGTHGKSTTSAMLATILDGAGDGAGFLVGTRVPGLGANADWRTGPGFVVEADESDGTFLTLGAHHGVVTNLEADHLSYWGSEDALFDGFRRFVRQLEGAAVLCLDDPGAAGLVADARQPVTYGTHAAADHRLHDIRPEGIGVAYTHEHDGRRVEVTVPSAPGAHNARNAAGAIAAAVTAGVPLDVAARALGRFAGVARRFEVRGEANGITFVDSYDHLPTEVAAAVQAARSGPFERVVCVFQPHRYTRTRDLAPTFADAFVGVDLLAVTELYPAGEPPIEGVTGRLVLEAVTEAHPDLPARFLPDLDAATTWLLDVLESGDCCLTLNAGDLTRVPDRVLEILEAGHGN